MWYTKDVKAAINIDGGKEAYRYSLPYGYYYSGTLEELKPIDLPARRPVAVTVAGSPAATEQTMDVLRVWLDFDQPKEKPISYDENRRRFLRRPFRPHLIGRYKTT